MVVAKRCRTGKAPFATKEAAQARLDEIIANPEPGRLYHPTRVAPRCSSCGQFHLTSNTAKRYAKGKRSRR